MRRATSSRSSVVSGLDRRVPKNPKYEAVRSTIDTGASVTKVKTITMREYLKRQEELFRRLRPHTLAAILDEGKEEEEGVGESLYESAAGVGAGAGAGSGALASSPVPSTGGSGLRVVVHSEEATVEYTKPYLILDVRDSDAFDACHIQDARIRADRFTPEVYRFKNKEGTMVVVYDYDERDAAPAATMMVEKGWDNVYLLHGGLKAFAEKNPFYVEGRPPTPPDSPKKSPSRMTSSRIASSRMSATSSVAGGAVGAAAGGGSVVSGLGRSALVAGGASVVAGTGRGTSGAGPSRAGSGLGTARMQTSIKVTRGGPRSGVGVVGIGDGAESVGGSSVVSRIMHSGRKLA